MITLTSGQVTAPQDIKITISVPNIILTPGVRKNIIKTLKNTANRLGSGVTYKIYDIFPDQPPVHHGILFKCNGKSCMGGCQDPTHINCSHTSNILHAENFQKTEGPDGDLFIEGVGKE